MTRHVREVLERHGDFAFAGKEPDAVAWEWLEAGFEDPLRVDAWLSAGCFLAASARALEDAGVTPEQAAIRTTDGTKNYEATIGYKLSKGDLSVGEAHRIITLNFWGY